MISSGVEKYLHSQTRTKAAVLAVYYKDSVRICKNK